jgi:hypothetical protein
MTAKYTNRALERNPSFGILERNRRDDKKKAGISKDAGW